MCTIHIKAGAAGLTLGKAWGLSLKPEPLAGERWGTRGLAGWLAGGGLELGRAGLIENALKAATFQKQKKSTKKQKKSTEQQAQKKAETGPGKKGK